MKRSVDTFTNFTVAVRETEAQQYDVRDGAVVTGEDGQPVLKPVKARLVSFSDEASAVEFLFDHAAFEGFAKLVVDQLSPAKRKALVDGAKPRRRARAKV